jgi:hypothetical protein
VVVELGYVVPGPGDGILGLVPAPHRTGYYLADALDDPGVLDRVTTPLRRAINAEVVASCWLTDDLLAVATTVSDEPFDDEDVSGFGGR